MKINYPKDRRITNAEDRFWSKVEKTDSCWLWKGAVGTSGYGVMQRGRRGRLLIRVHRFSYEMHHGPIPLGKLILHSCNNKLCVHPDHIRAGTYSDNLRDAWRDGLQSPNEHQLGFGNMFRKLSDTDISSIRTMNLVWGVPVSILAIQYSVHIGIIYGWLDRKITRERSSAALSFRAPVCVDSYWGETCLSFRQ